MATIICANDGRSAYADVLAKIRLFGVRRPSRNGDTLDLGHTTIVLDEPFHALPVGVGRGLSEKIAAAEAIQLIGSFSDPEWLVKLAPQMSAYREPEGGFWGAYGARIGGQISCVVDKLRDDPWTRQAVATLWQPSHDNVPNRLDYPCTVALGFTLRPRPGYVTAALDMHVTMRSNDAWLGLPYDMFQFTQLHQTVCRVLAFNRGHYTHTAWSMHLYERDVEASHDVGVASPFTYFDPRGLGDMNMEYREVMERARTIALRPEKIHWELTANERWYRDALHGPSDD